MGKIDFKATGGIMLYRLYDVCWESDLDMVETKTAGSRRLKIERKRFSKAFEFSNPPVTIGVESFEREILGATHTVRAYGKVYDFGGMSIILELPLTDLPIDRYISLAQELRYSNPFEADFRRIRDRLTSTLAEALKGKGMTGIEEDYSVYYIRKTEPAMGSLEMLAAFDAGSLLLAEESEAAPSEASLKGLVPYTFSYSDSDAVVVNWDNALVVEPSGSMDIPDLLEFANVQLLELRVYDELLDRELDVIYSTISKKAPASIWKVRHYQGLAAKVMRTFTELMYITEKVDNSLKVTEDVYYARVYAAALELFKVKTWEDSIKNKFDISSRTYNMLTQAISNRRSELLELIIIILIAVEIVFFVFWEVNK